MCPYLLSLKVGSLRYDETKRSLSSRNRSQLGLTELSLIMMGHIHIAPDPGNLANELPRS